MPEYSEDLIRRCRDAAESVPWFWTRVDAGAPSGEIYEVGWGDGDEAEVLARTSNRQEARVMRDILEERARVRAVLLAAGYVESLEGEDNGR